MLSIQEETLLILNIIKIYRFMGPEMSVHHGRSYQNRAVHIPEKETECGQEKDVLPQSDDYLDCQFTCIWNQQKHKPCTLLRGFLIIIFKADTLYIWATSSRDIPDESTQEKEILPFASLS